MDCSNLAELLSALENSNIVTNDQFQKLEIYRKGLNGEHHEFSFGDNTEDNISHAKDILDYLYKL